jgi:predicted amidohydrolase
MFLAACVQLHCTTDVERNLATTEHLVRRAASLGAAFIATPENTPFLGPQFHKVSLAEPLDGPTGQRLAGLAAELGIHLLIGGLAERRVDAAGQPDPKRCYNTSVLYGPDGSTLAAYRKMHLFDVDIPGGLTILESDSIAPGPPQPVVAETVLGRMGLSICYDLRFPELYRGQADLGAELLMVPSAFTATTGKDHWHVLLRARAIETQCWVLAPAQWGVHDPEGKRHSYGHSVIIDPWGIVVADKGHGEGLCLAEIDLDRAAKVRQSIPVRDHRRL